MGWDEMGQGTCDLFHIPRLVDLPLEFSEAE